MSSLRKLASLLVAIATVAISVAAVPVHAQSSTPSATCDTSFGTDAANVFQSVSAATNGTNLKAADFAPVSVSLAKIRIEYEDVTAPAGCEDARQVLVRIAALDEDVMLLNVLARLDTSAARYVDFVNNVWQPRFTALKANLAGTATPVTAAASSGSGVCADKNFLSQVATDLGTMQSGATTNPDAVGTMLLALLKVRYKYEDVAAPAGCEAVNTDMVKVLGTAEDSILGTMGAQADPTNAKTYTDFLNTSVFTRGTTLFNMLSADLGLPAPTAAATASS